MAVSGSCQFTPGKWKLTVDRYDATRLRVIFAIRSGEPGSSWQLFGSDNGHPFVTKYKTADQFGIVRVRWRPLDRAGSDLIEAAGSESSPSTNTCSGRLTF